MACLNLKKQHKKRPRPIIKYRVMIVDFYTIRIRKFTCEDTGSLIFFIPDGWDVFRERRESVGVFPSDLMIIFALDVMIKCALFFIKTSFSLIKNKKKKSFSSHNRKKKHRDLQTFLDECCTRLFLLLLELEYIRSLFKAVSFVSSY